MKIKARRKKDKIVVLRKLTLYSCEYGKKIINMPKAINVGR